MSRSSRTGAALAAVALGLVGCGDDEAAAVERYCAAVAATEERGVELFGDLDEGDGAAVAEAEAAILAFVRANYPEPGAMPAEVRDDEAAFLAGFVARIEDGVEPTAEQQAAEERLLAWQEAHCGSA